MLNIRLEAVLVIVPLLLNTPPLPTVVTAFVAVKELELVRVPKIEAVLPLPEKLSDKFVLKFKLDPLGISKSVPVVPEIVRVALLLAVKVIIEEFRKYNWLIVWAGTPVTVAVFPSKIKISEVAGVVLGVPKPLT